MSSSHTIHTGSRRLVALAATGLALALGGCGPAARPLPRLEHYDFLGQTRADLARLRQMAPSETEAGPLARYALARAHAEWLILALIRDRDDDELMRLLAVDLGVEGASPDDRLTLPQTLATIDAVLQEVRDGAAAGGEARPWSGDMERLLEAVREGWEEFSPDLIRAVAEISAAEGPASRAAELLALGWGRLTLTVSQHRPPAERAPLLARLAGFFDPDVVEALHRGRTDLIEAGLDLSCPDLGSEARDLPAPELLARVRRDCGSIAADLGLPPEAGPMMSPELALFARVIGDLRERRRRLGAVTGDPLVEAATEDLAAFDALLPALRFPLPLPAPGPALPEPARVDEPGVWRPAGAVISVHEGRTRIALWPTLVVAEGELRLADRVEGFGLPGRPAPSDMTMALNRTWREAEAQLGIRARSVALLLPSDTGIDRLIELLEACRGAEASRVDLVVLAGEHGLASVPVGVARGAAAARATTDRRALLVLSPEGVRIGTAEGTWVELDDVEGEPDLEGIAPVLGHHLAGHGNASCIVAVRPGCTVARVARLADLLARTPRTLDGANRGWQVALDPEDLPAEAPAASTPAAAVDAHRTRLRGCYERFLRGGGSGQGRVVLEIAVSAGGEVESARVVETELGPQPALDTCLVREALQIRFPSDVATPTIRIPLRFVPR